MVNPEEETFKANTRFVRERSFTNKAFLLPTSFLILASQIFRKKRALLRFARSERGGGVDRHETFLRVFATQQRLHRIERSRWLHSEPTQRQTSHPSDYGGTLPTFCDPFEREDIEALSLALYRIPKTVEKPVERLSIYPGKWPREGFLRQAELLGQAADAVAFMVKQLRPGAKLDGVKKANERLQFAEGEAGKVMLAPIRDLYVGPYDAKETMILQGLFEMTEKSIDRCRDAGNVVFQIVLKYS